MYEDPLVRALTSFGESGYLATLKRNLPARVAARVRFLGPVPHNRLLELYRQADAFVFPSVWHEPFGVPVVEAQSAALPVVSTRSGGIPELIRDGITGVLVDRADSHQLADAFARILTDNEVRSRMGPSGRRHVAKPFSWDTVSESYVSLYERLIDKTQSHNGSAHRVVLDRHSSVRSY
jgi:glycosyltransferase involved in cell wall biosynthesis